MDFRHDFSLFIRAVWEYESAVTPRTFYSGSIWLSKGTKIKKWFALQSSHSKEHLVLIDVDSLVIFKRIYCFA